MPAKIRSIGIIRLQPCALDRLGGPCDDSTLDRLLASLVHRRSLTDGPIPRRQSARLLGKRQLNWPGSSAADLSLNANMAQLVDDLQAELDGVENGLL